MSNKIFKYGEDTLSTGLVLDIAHGKVKAGLGENSRERVLANWKAVQNIVEKKKIVYGVNTGFGSLCNKIISPEDTKTLQYNILKSHSVGVGNPIDTEIAKIMLILKMQALSQGYSGVAIETLERINWHINNNAIPVVPEQGSVGASGDLAPLSHLFLPLIGLGLINYKGKVIETAELFKKEGLEPINLGPKEGLALINGTQFIAAHAVKAVERLGNMLDTADIVGAMSLEGLLGSKRPFLADLHKIRPYKGTQYVAHRLRTLLANSEMVESHTDCTRVQDPYSLRCMPQVHGASRNAWAHLRDSLNVELNAVTDNPIVLDEENTISGGNFHGQPMALPLDYATLASAEIGNISDRRCYLMLEGGYDGLPVLLLENTGINSGFMIPQYTTAALVTENKSLCFPPSADSVPTSLGQEDHVSMGSISGRRVNQVLTNIEKIFAIELMCAAQAFDFRRPKKSSALLETCYSIVREKIAFAEVDRVFGDDIEIARQIIASNVLVKAVNETATENNIDLKGEFGNIYSIY